MVEGIHVLEVKMLPDDAGNAMASVAAAAYSIGFRQRYEPDFDYRNALRAFYEQPEIIVTKKTKRNAFYEQNGATLDEIALLITREETYMNIGNEEQRELVPLGFIGKEF